MFNFILLSLSTSDRRCVSCLPRVFDMTETHVIILNYVIFSKFLSVLMSVLCPCFVVIKL